LLAAGQPAHVPVVSTWQTVERQRPSTST
jgi:hypothetical protein